MTENPSSFVSVHTLANRFEADVLVDALRQEGIPVLLRPFEETAYTGLFVPQKGWGRVMVPREKETEARRIICDLMEDVPCAEPPIAGGEAVDPLLWDRLRGTDPEWVAANGVVEYDAGERAYIVPFLNTAILCYPEEERIEVVGAAADFSTDFQLCLVVLHYLLDARDVPFSKKWVGEKDLPSGTLFFQGPHALPIEGLAEAFDSRPQLLNRAAVAIGGEKINLGDLSFRFWFLPRLPLVTVFWMGDEEFKPSFHFLFDESIAQHLRSLDLVWAMVSVFSRVLIHAAASVPEGEQDEE